jgi:uncharacterized membrane protein YcaP (DUF421 family)
MDKNFEVFDFHRIFFGDAPFLFLLEIVFRTFIMYVYTVFLLRLLGKREMGQLSILELAIIISFGSAVGDPMIGANIPIIYGLITMTSIAIFQIGLERLINMNKKVESLMEGSPTLLVENGQIIIEGLKKDNLSKEDLFRSLRVKEVEHLGQIQKAFSETNGQISVIFYSPKSIKPGLSVLPEKEISDSLKIKKQMPVEEPGHYCCTNCGTVRAFQEKEEVSICKVCSGEEWMKAIN